jgi:hypothetical protein
LVKRLFDEFHADALAWEATVAALSNFDDELAQSAAVQWAATTTAAFLTALEPALLSRAPQLRAHSLQPPVSWLRGPVAQWSSREPLAGADPPAQRSIWTVADGSSRYSMSTDPERAVC